MDGIREHEDWEEFPKGRKSLTGSQASGGKVSVLCDKVRVKYVIFRRKADLIACLISSLAW